jgi:hypothetical protein
VRNYKRLINVGGEPDAGRDGEDHAARQLPVQAASGGLNACEIQAHLARVGCNDEKY